MNTARTPWPVAATALLSALVTIGCGDDSEAPAAERHGGGSVTTWTAAVELFFEYPPLVAGRESDPWAIHLTVLDGFAPVTQGVLTLRFTSGERTHEVRAEAPVRSGIYTPTATLPAAGRYDLVMRVDGPQVTDTIPAGSVRVYASVDELPTEEPEPASGIAFLKEQQWPIPFATRVAVRRAVARNITAPGELLPAADRYAEVAAPVAGLVLADANRTAPAPGDRVARGQVLAVLAPTDDEGSYAALVARVERLEREVARAERLYAAQAIARKRLEESRHDLAAARAALEAMGGATGGYELLLRAPFAGVIAERRMVAGSRVEPGDPLFTVVDPSTLWLRFHVAAEHTARLTDVTGAHFSVEGSSRVRPTARLVSIGDVIDPTRRTLPVVFAVANPDRVLKAGALATGRLLLGDAQEDVAVPAAAVRMEDGVPVAYVQVGGELFQRRVLTLGPTDGEWTIVRNGISAGEHVVTEGAYQVRLAALNPDAVADHGHPH